jgi:tol-pal system protein YbgF
VLDRATGGEGLVNRLHATIVLGMVLGTATGCAGPRILRLEKDVEELREVVQGFEQRQALMQAELERVQRENRELLAQAPSGAQPLPAPTPAFQPAPSAPAAAAAPAATARPRAVEEVDLELPRVPVPAVARGGAAMAELGVLDPEDVEMMGSAPDLYAAAFGNFQKASYHKAILQFNVFVERYPQHDLTDNAFYWMGECWYGLRNYPRAIAAFDMVLEHYPKGNKAPDCLLKKAYALQRAGRRGEALTALQDLVRRFPGSTSAAKAQAKMKELQQTQS